MDANIDQPLAGGRARLQLRKDLEIYSQHNRQRRVWVIKDPLSLRYFQFSDEEFEILRRLNGYWSLEQIKSQFEERFTSLRMTVARLHAFVVELHRNGLIISDAPNQGQALLARRQRNRRRIWLERLANPLAIRFPGFDPQPLLDRLYPRLRWCFSKGCVAAVCLLVAVSLLVIGLQFDQLADRLPNLSALVEPQNLLWLAVILAATKLLHEFGHALTCKHFAGECHEMGVMLLVLTPCLYCDVTDAWKLASRWQRIAISAAGMGVEVVLAAVFALLWCFSQPGFFNTLCLNVVVVCSVGTIFLNGNPLLRYDGYYILSDLCQTPNLWRQSRARVYARLSRFFWGFAPPDPHPFQSGAVWMQIYAICSMAYRLLILASILYLIHRVLAPLGFSIVAQSIAITTVAGLLLAPIRAIWRTTKDPRTRRLIVPRRVLFSVSSLLVLGAIVWLVPFPCRVTAKATIEPLGARRVYVSETGRLTHAISIGDEVETGDVLAQLENASTELELKRVQGERLRQEIRVRNLEVLRSEYRELSAQLPTAREILADLEQRQSDLERDLAALTLAAPIGGIVLPPPPVADPSADNPQLPTWSNTPLAEHNLGCTLERRTLLCMVGQPDRYEAIVYIDQSAVPLVRPGQPVHLRFDVAPGHVVSGVVRRVSRNRLDLRDTVDDQQRESSTGDRRPWRGDEILYQTHVEITADDVPLLIGAKGFAKVFIEPQPLVEQLYRFVSKTFIPVT